MKIFNNNIEKAMQIYKKQGINKLQNTTTSKISKKDQVELSSTAKDFQYAMKLLKDVPDVRQDKIDSIKNQIKTGTYKIDSGKIVEKMYESINIDKRV